MDNGINVITDGITMKTAAQLIGEVSDRTDGQPVTRQMVNRLIKQGYIKKVARGIVSLESVKAYVAAKRQLNELKHDA